MTSDAYKHAITTFETHFERKFSTDSAIRQKLLNQAFRQVQGCSDSALMRACDSIMLRERFLPDLETIISEVKRVHMDDVAKEDAAQERRAGSYEKYPEKKPLSDNMRKALRAMTDYKPTRKQWNQIIQALYREEGVSDHLGPTYYAMMCERHNLDMDEPAFAGGLSDVFGG